MSKSRVSIVRVSPEAEYDAVLASVRQAVDLVGGLAGVVRSGDLVIIKPNVLAPSAPDDGALTHPSVCRAIADLVRERGARPVIAESSAVGVDTEKAFASVGYDVLRDLGYEVIDLKKEAPAKITVDEPLVMEAFATWQIVRDADVIISVPVLKTHDQAEMTLSLKNLKGLEADKDKKELHRRGIFKGVADLASALKPALTVIDGIVGQEGLGPLYGVPIRLGLLLASRDLVAADAVASVIAGFEPEEVGTTFYAAQKGLGTMDLAQIEVVGEPIESVQRRFMRCSEDLRVKVEDFQILHAPGTCTGCRNTVLSVMFDMKNANQLEYLTGMTIITGPGVEIPAGIPPESIVAVGICVPPERRGRRFVTGCPPNNVGVVQELLGGRSKVTRTYATGDDPSPEDE
jgi:uncharacterized protein (DUF362 family)